jgi:hypothetical protein
MEIERHILKEKKTSSEFQNVLNCDQIKGKLVSNFDPFFKYIINNRGSHCDNSSQAPEILAMPLTNKTPTIKDKTF